MSDANQSIVSDDVDRRHSLDDSLSSDEEHYQTAKTFEDNDDGADVAAIADQEVAVMMATTAADGNQQQQEAIGSPLQSIDQDRSASLILDETYDNWPVASRHPSWPSPSTSTTTHNSNNNNNNRSPADPNNSSVHMPAPSSQLQLACSTPLIRYEHLPLHRRPKPSPELPKRSRHQPKAPAVRWRTDTELHESNVRYLNRVLGPMQPVVKTCPADLLPRVNIDLPKEGLETRVTQLPLRRTYGIRL